MAPFRQANLLQTRRTKIVATLGPASNSRECILRLIQAGVNVFRLNMSHGDHDSHRETHSTVREVAEELNLPIAILVDLCGPKIRAGKFKNGGITLKAGQEVIVTTRDVIGEEGLIPSQYTALAEDVQAGNDILLNDGAIALEVSSISGTEITCRVQNGGILKDHKGINLPGVNVSAPSMTEKDHKDALFALGLGVDFLALSFVRRAEDIIGLKKVIEESGQQAQVIAKIEKPEALTDIDAILEEADGIMVARGDLGVELKPEQVPVVQSQLIQKALAYFKPVIVATQMLESMIENPRPTRAEVTDVSNAVSLGTDAVMLSGETAAGAYPVETVEMMERVIRQTEAHIWNSGGYGNIVKRVNQQLPLSIWEAVSDVAGHLSKSIMASAIIVISESGMSAATISSSRPAAPVVGVTSHPNVYRKMALYWSVIPVLDENVGVVNPNGLSRTIAQGLKITQPGENVLIVRGFHGDPALNTPSVTVITT